MPVFCPKCGKENQTESAYCRKCGNELPELKEDTKQEGFQKKIKTLTNLSFIVSCVGALFTNLFAMYLLLNDYLTGELFFIFILIEISCFIFLFNSIIGLFNRHYIKRVKFSSENEDQKTIKTETVELLSEADYSNSVPESVVENTTRKLYKD